MIRKLNHTVERINELTKHMLYINGLARPLEHKEGKETLHHHKGPSPSTSIKPGWLQAYCITILLWGRGSQRTTRQMFVMLLNTLLEGALILW
ncbi:unnamed protein product [Caretta caretta]